MAPDFEIHGTRQKSFEDVTQDDFPRGTGETTSEEPEAPIARAPVPMAAGRPFRRAVS